MTLIDEIGAEMAEINELYFEISTKDEEYFEQNEREILDKQLVLWILLTKGRMYADKKQSKEITIIFNIFWEYYKRRKDLSKYSISMEEFIEKYNEHASFMEYVSGEADPLKREEDIQTNLAQVSARALDIWIYLYWDSSKALRKFGDEVRDEFSLNIRALVNNFDKLKPIL